MGLDLEIVIGIIVLTLLGVFLTGPGMWSEKWGWSALRGKNREPPQRGSRGAPPPEGQASRDTPASQRSRGTPP